MSAVPKSNIDPSKITGMYQVLGAFLAATELLLAFWFFKATDVTERIVIGSLMTLILLAFLVVLFLLTRTRVESPPEKPTVPGIGALDLPTKETTLEKIESPAPESYVGPNRAYMINRPPDNWTIRELTLNEWVAQGMGITDPAIAERILGKAQESPEILTFQTGSLTSLVPMPGKTTINGRKYPTALEVSAVIRLGIISIPRMSEPPLFVERPLIHNFTTFLSGILKTGMMTIHDQTIGKVPNTQRQQITTSLRQEVENVIVNGQEGKSVTSNLVMIGIEGDLHDHVLIMQYPALKDVDDPELEQAQKTLNSLVASFRPVKVPNLEQLSREYKAAAELNFQEYMATQGVNIFANEFQIFLYRLSGTNLDDPEIRLRAIKSLKSFKVFADEVQLQDDSLARLWNYLQEAEDGNALNLKAELKHLVEVARSGGENQEAPPAGVAADAPQNGEENQPLVLEE